jgi:hypothetical protein
VATIQLDQEVLDVEGLIDDRNHDEAFRQLILLRDRFGRRPEYRYLKALFDMTFEVRSDTELLADVRSLVGEQPDFLEAVSLLAVVLDRTGDHDRATVFAREAIHAGNERARLRAQSVLGETPSNPTADEEPFARRSSTSLEAVQTPTPEKEKPASRPMVVPTPVGTDAKTRETQEMFTADSEPAPDFDPFQLPSKPPPLHETDSVSGDTLEGLPRPPSAAPASMEGLTKPSTMPPERQPGSYRPPTSPPMGLPSEPPGVMRLGGAEEMPPSDARGLSETIPFSPADMVMPPPPTIPPDALDMSDPSVPDRSAPPQDDRTAPTLRGLRTPAAPRVEDGRAERAEASPAKRADLTRPTVDERIERSQRLTDRPPPVTREPTPLPPQYAVDRTGVDRGSPERKRSVSRPSRPAIAIPEPVPQVRAWFQYARDNQLRTGDGFSTARTLLDLCERVVEGATPLSSDPVPMDRRGLILIEERLESMRGARSGTQQAAERGAVTAAAAFLLGLLLKECDGRATDTSAEDGACKVVVPSGATVRPLLVAAAFARARGPGLVETFDRAATAHMRRGPTRRTGGGAGARAVTQPKQERVDARSGSEFDLTVLRRDLDGSTLGVIDPDAPPAPQPPIDMRQTAVGFWASDLGRELIGSSRRVGTFTIADVDAIERYASKKFSAVGFAPPGTPWPWSPSEDFEDLVLSWGGVIGEVLVALYSGRWEADPGNPEDRQLFRVVLSGGVVAWPVAKAYMRLARGIPHDLSVYIDAVGRVVGRQALGAQAWPDS